MEMTDTKNTSVICCVKCNRPVSHDEIGLYKRIFNRGAETFWCIHCISEYLDCPVPKLEKKIAEFRDMGCTCLLYTSPICVSNRDRNAGLLFPNFSWQSVKISAKESCLYGIIDVRITPFLVYGL